MIKLIKLLNEAYVSEDMLKQLATEMGETIVDFLGTGANGKAYLTQSGKVIKYTEDSAEVALASRLRKKRLYKHIVNVYDVRAIENLNDAYIILMDKVDTLNDSQEAQWNAVRREYLDRKNSDKQFLDWVDYQPERTASRTIDSEFINKITQQRAGLLRDFSELRIVWDEAHGGNMGWNKHGNLVHFDAWQEEHYTKGYRTRFNGEPIRRDDGKLDTDVNELPYQKGLSKPLQAFKNRNN
jgi:hypothetical protein